MSQVERVNVSLEVEGESVKLNNRIARMKPKLPSRPICKEGNEAGCFEVTRGTKGDIVSLKRIG
jgi:hypothetical protein